MSANNSPAHCLFPRKGIAQGWQEAKSLAVFGNRWCRCRTNPTKYQCVLFYQFWSSSVHVSGKVGETVYFYLANGGITSIFNINFNLGCFLYDSQTHWNFTENLNAILAWCFTEGRFYYYSWVTETVKLEHLWTWPSGTSSNGLFSGKQWNQWYRLLVLHHVDWLNAGMRKPKCCRHHLHTAFVCSQNSVHVLISIHRELQVFAVFWCN